MCFICQGLSARVVPRLVPDRLAVGRCALHGHVPGWAGGLGSLRRGTVTQHPAHNDLARCPLVPVAASLWVVPAPPAWALHPHGESLEHTFEHIYTNRAGLEAVTEILPQRCTHA